MSNTDEIRWKQRFQNFEKAFCLLKEVLENRTVDEYSMLEKEGIIQRFEYTFELSWKTVKDRLFYDGYDVKSPRAVIRKAFEVELISEEDAEVWLNSLDKRNLLSHTYDEKAAKEALEAIQGRYYPLIKRIYTNLKVEADNA